MPISRRAFTGLAPAALLPRMLFSQTQTQTLFRHGVASGDPTASRVILWTRVSPVAAEEMIQVEWLLAADPAMNRVLQRGVTYTNPAFDYTVKVDVTRLNPDTTYYYLFIVRGVSSPVGRTKTLPVGEASRLRFTVVSCSNFPYGYFNAYRAMARRADLDFVLHLGDYIYEYANGDYGNGTPLNRVPAPNKETTTLADYRQRYAQYRADPDLQEAHRQHPWIIVWDDHESANDSWNGGAQNHTEGSEGDWAARRYAAVQAWFEWQPVRENPQADGQIYRSFPIGNLAELIMLDTRLAGRDQQVMPNSPAVADPNRSLLGADQEEWFFQRLTSSKRRNARWRIVGQQVMMGQLLSPDGSAFNADQWDGYIASRNRFLQYTATNSIGNIVVLTGDIHSSWANEVTANPFTGSFTPQAVEFVTPAVSSPGIDDRAQATALQGQIGATHPHVKYVELFRRGYLLVDLDADRAQAEFYHVRTITERSADEETAAIFTCANGTSRLVRAASASGTRSGAPPFAP